MTERISAEGGPPLEIVLDTGYLPVSNVSSLLRIFQAALREVARGVDSASDPFAEPPYPALRMKTASADGALVLSFGFFDPVDSSPMTDLSERTCRIFMDRLGEVIKRLPQRGLWGDSVAGPQDATDDSPIGKRLDQLRAELRRFGKARVSFASRTISFEGDRMELS
ncbi:MAG: hypothetical protein O3A47_04685 [Chloroflexi bacterium]|nr:hypothetical protein [Chloroflexota bacterium]